MSKGSLIFFCGKMGAGKTTKAKAIALERNAVLLSEDEWLESVFPNKIKTLNEYIKYSNLLKPQIKKVTQSILSTGTNVVMDFPANTVSQREWFRSIFNEIEASHELIYIEATNDTCLRQIKQRVQEQPERASTDTLEMFESVTKYFVEPHKNEGFKISIIHKNA